LQAPSGKEIWAIMDCPNYNGAFWCHSTGPGADVVWNQMTSPFYNGGGTTGVMTSDIKAVDMEVYSGSGDKHMLILENGPGNKSLEIWVPVSQTYVGDIDISALNNPIDVSVDSDNYIYVLNINASAEAEIWMYDNTGAVIGFSGAIASGDLPGPALRLDVALNSDPDELRVLYNSGVTRFSAY